MRSLVGPNVILIGHGLKEDLLRMKLIHNKVVDTTVLYPHAHYGKINSLKWLWKTHFANRPVTSDGNKALGDCIKTLRLVKKKVC